MWFLVFPARGPTRPQPNPGDSQNYSGHLVEAAQQHHNAGSHWGQSGNTSHAPFSGWVIFNKGVLQELIMGPFQFLISDLLQANVQ